MLLLLLLLTQGVWARACMDACIHAWSCEQNNHFAQGLETLRKREFVGLLETVYGNFL